MIWILNRVHSASPTVASAFGDAHIREDTAARMAQLFVAEPKRLDGVLLEAPWADVIGALAEVKDRIEHLRSIVALSFGVLPQAASAHLVRALGVVDAASAYGATGEEETRGARFLSALAVRALTAESLIELSRALLAIDRAAQDAAKR